MEWILSFTKAGISKREMIVTASISFFKTLALFSIFFYRKEKLKKNSHKFVVMPCS
jgi:hypothetical protein